MQAVQHKPPVMQAVQHKPPVMQAVQHKPPVGCTGASFLPRPCRRVHRLPTTANAMVVLRSAHATLHGCANVTP
jgi:hypothetical protein